MKLFARTSAFFLFCFIAIFTFIQISKGNSDFPKNTAIYNVVIDENDHRLMKVKARFTRQDDVLYMSENGAGQFPERWAKFVRNLKIKDSDGKALKFKELAGAKWKVESPKNQTITIEYEVTLDHEKHEWAGGIDGVAFAKDWGVFYTGRSFLIMNGQNRADIKLNFELPPKWHISGSWNRTNPNSFTARNLTDISESMFFAGTHKEFSIKRDGFELLFALGGDEIVAQENEFKNLAQGVLDYYIKLMDGIPIGSPDNKFKKSLVIINLGKQIDGEVIGDHINMIFDPNGDKKSKILAKFIFAHEFFHLWNGKTIRVTDTIEDWFKEGVTSYYTLKALNHTGAISEQEVFDTLNDLFYQRYRTDEGFGKLSMRDMATGFTKHKHWGLIYAGGLFAGVCQDIAVRNSTKNKKSLDDLMRDFYKIYGGKNKTYSTLDLQNHLSNLSGSNQADFFKQYIFGVKPIPIAECLSNAGLKAKVENEQLKIGRNSELTDLQKSILKGVLGR